MYSYEENLNYDIIEENYIKHLQEMLNNYSDQPVIFKKEKNNNFSLEGSIHKKIHEQDVVIHIKIEFDQKTLYNIKLELKSQNINDKTNYDIELKLFYYEEIKGKLLDAVNNEKRKFTLRVYKLIYNCEPIYGCYEINGEYKILFHTLDETPRDEPLTEHVLCFDIELEERNFERARSMANSVIAEFVNFLSVLLDISFHEPISKYVNYITTRYISVDKVLIKERFRTAFFDSELELYVKDNMNGLCPKKEVENENFTNGYFSLNPYNGSVLYQMKLGNTKAIEELFCKHRIYKIKEKVDSIAKYQDEISVNIHYPNQSIKIPRQIRIFFRGIESYKKQDFEKYSYFRNACRLYNKSKILGATDASIEISFLVASIEALSKTESNMSFSNFAIKYNADVTKEELDLMYSIRSKLFHTGNFSFFEFDFDVNPYSNPLYIEFQQKYILYKSVLRKVFVNWINTYIVST